MATEAELIATWSYNWQWVMEHFRRAHYRRGYVVRCMLEKPLPRILPIGRMPMQATETVEAVDFWIEDAEEDFGQYPQQMAKVLTGDRRHPTVVWTGRIVW